LQSGAMSFLLCSSACSNCSRAPDKQADTVMVNPGLAGANGKPVDGKEDQLPAPPALQLAASEAQHLAEAERQLEQRRRASEEATEAIRWEEERRAREEEERRLHEERRRAELEVERARHEAVRREAEARAEEAARLEEQKHLAERCRQEEESRCAEEARKGEELRTFLGARRLKGVNDRKKGGLFSGGYSYPLHLAVRAKNAAAIEILLWGGADPGLLDSKGLSPISLAQMVNKKDSHTPVIAALQGPRRR